MGRRAAASRPVGCERCAEVSARFCAEELRAAIGDGTESSPVPAVADDTGSDVSARWDRRVRMPGSVRGALVMPPRWPWWDVTRLGDSRIVGP